MAKEIKGFNEAYRRATAIESLKEFQRKSYKKDVDYLVKEGMDRNIAKVYAKSMRDAGISIRFKGGKK